MEPGSSEPGDQFAAAAAVQNIRALQWSQVLANPETASWQVRPSVVRWPSMEPGSSEPGDAGTTTAAADALNPSMEPGSSEPGDW